MLNAKAILEKFKTSDVLEKLKAGKIMELFKSSDALERLKTTKLLETLRTNNVSPGWLTPLKTFGSKNALGIDISDKQINLALLKKGKNGPELLKYASAPVPDGAIVNGSIEDASALAGAIQKLKNSNKIRPTRAAVSLFTKPVIVQIMGVPKQVPTNIGQFIQDQVKNFAILPGNKIAFDFCGVSRTAGETNFASRLLVAAADDRKVDEIVKVCNQAGVIVETIEPPLLAYSRALYAGKIKGKFDCNVLIAILQDNTLTLSVFKKQTIDFVRTKSIDEEKTAPDEIAQWLAEQINMIIQFYDVETPDSSGKWETVLVADSTQLPQNAEQSLKAKVANADLQLLTSEDVCKIAVAANPDTTADSNRNNKPSPVAIGLAMKLLKTDMNNLSVNLLPQKVTRVRTTQREILTTATIIAAMFLFMVSAVSWPNLRIKKMNENTTRKEINLLNDTSNLAKEQKSLNKQIKTVSSKLDQINTALGTYSNTDWAVILNDIGKRIPKVACINSLSGVTNSGMSLKGTALSIEAVYLFADMLNESEHITSAVITGTNRDNDGLIKYEISCAMATIEGK